MRMGARGPHVVELQRRLNELGFGSLETDGIFGPATASAVRIYQQAMRLEVDGAVGPITQRSLRTREMGSRDGEPGILRVLRGKEYQVDIDGKINIIGVRSVPGRPNKFDDRLHLVWWDRTHWEHKVFPCTCDPGTYWVDNPSNVDGAATMEPGQYVNAYVWGLHRGKYEALCQRGGPIQFRRTETVNELEEDYIGANIHHAGVDSENVDKWSAACQVFKRLEDWNMAIGIWKSSGQEAFTYTLLLSTDVT